MGWVDDHCIYLNETRYSFNLLTYPSDQLDLKVILIWIISVVDYVDLFARIMQSVRCLGRTNVGLAL